MLESKYQRHLIERIQNEFPGAVVLKNDPTYIQGIPDLLTLYENKWAMLEAKKSINEQAQPNQEYYVDLFNKMSFASFIYPENEEDILYDLQQAFKFRRRPRISWR